jgi:hypothetical protein
MFLLTGDLDEVRAKYRESGEAQKNG